MRINSRQTQRLHTRTIPAALLLLGAALMLAAPAHAVAPTRSVIDSLRAEGTLDAYLALRRDAAARGVDAPVELSRVPTRNLAASGMTIDYRIPCILVDFSDNPASGGLINTTPQMMHDQLFTTGVNPDGSFKEYYAEISYGQMNVIGTVVGWYRMPNTYAYYMNGEGGIGSYPRNSQKLAQDAVFAASGDLNFAEFDNSPADGFVDGVMLVVPGRGGEETGDLNDLHSHKFAVPMPYPVYNGKQIRDYTIQPEESSSSHGPLNPVGVFCHEWGHILGLPDLYDLDDCDSLEICGDQLSSGLGDWSLMALGNWLPNYDGYLPAHPDAWCRIHMGFATATTILTNQVDYPIPSVESTPTILRLWEGGATGAEYFLVENRWKTGFDAAIPGQGLLIYHVDDNMNSNRYQWIEGTDPPSAPHYWVSLEQADGLFSLEKFDGQGNAGDPYSSDSVGIDHLSYPSTNKYYTGASSQVAVWNISDPGATMTANLDVFYSRPLLEASGYGVADPAGDGDGLPEAGETFELTFDLHNYMKDASNVQVVVSAPNSDLVFVDDTYNLASLASDATIRNTADPIRVSVPDQYRSRKVEFVFDVSAESGTYHWTELTKIAIGPPRTLVVDDDRGGTRELKMTSTLDSLNELYAVWDVSTQGDPSGATLEGYPLVFWMTGDSNSVSPTMAGVSAMQSYLDAGGHLFLTGQDIAENISERADASFLSDYLGITYSGNEQFAVANGVPGDIISDGLKLNGGSVDGSKNQTSPDRIALAGGSAASALAVVCYTYHISGLNAAVHIDNGYRVVFFGFGFEAVSSYSLPQGYNTRPQILQPIVNWLDPDLATGIFDEPGGGFAGAGVPRAFELAQNYPNPFNAATIIPFTLTGSRAQHVRLDVFDILGRRVQTLKDEDLEPGAYQITWNGQDHNGQSVASGVYFYRLTIGDKSALAKKMILLK